MKTCRNINCSQNNPQPLGNFSKHKECRDGLRTHCKSCASEEYQRKKEQYREYGRKRRREKHREIQESSAIYREANKEAIKKYQAEYYQNNKSKIKGRSSSYYSENKESVLIRLSGDGSGNRRAALKRKYDMTLEQYDELLSQQGGACAICRNPENISGRSLAVDHCHKSGRIRGLLCFECNIALGKFDDNADYLRRALDYLIQNEVGAEVAPAPTHRLQD